MTDLEKLVVASRDQAVVRLRDIADIALHQFGHGAAQGRSDAQDGPAQWQ